MLHPDTPRAARWLGPAGLIPFAAPAIGVWVLAPDIWPVLLHAQLVYAALIASFLGGLHWGRYLGGGVPDGWLIWSVVPSLIAWAALILAPFHTLIVLIALFAICFLVDRKAVAAGLWPAWMGGLRKFLTLGAMACLIAMLMRIVSAGVGNAG